MSCAIAALVLAAGGCGSSSPAQATPQTLRAAYFAPMTDFEHQNADAVCGDLTPTSAEELVRFRWLHGRWRLSAHPGVVAKSGCRAPCVESTSLAFFYDNARASSGSSR